MRKIKKELIVTATMLGLVVAILAIGLACSEPTQEEVCLEAAKEHLFLPEETVRTMEKDWTEWSYIEWVKMKNRLEYFGLDRVCRHLVDLPPYIEDLLMQK